MVDVAPQAIPQARAHAPTALRRYYVLGLLTTIYALNFLDRTIFNVLIEPIKKEFALSDTMMGLLAGFGFVLFYSILGIPIARAADRLNRRNIVAVAFAFWSAMTFLCGLASSVTTLALARIGVGIGESAGTPASQSLVADLFTKNERPRALGIYAIGTYLGVFLGYFIGGWVSQHYGWRTAFMSAGLPGLVLAAVLWLTVAEPARGASEPGSASVTPDPLGATLRFLFTQRSFVIVLIGFCLTTYTNYATSAWIPPFLARVHHLSSAEIGTYAGTFKGLCGMAGTLVGGLVVARISRRDDRWKLWAPALMSGLAGPVFAVCMLTPSFTIMVAALAATSFLVGFHLGPIFAIAQTVARPSMRALASAIVLLTATCFGQGVGPLAVGMISDMLKASYGADAVRYALLSAGATSTLGALLFVWAAGAIRGDIARAT
ncbi:MFS transporter [Bradyrhizobium sp. U87765 SZCCT0131]|uniref:spinster family MFS transporter n=1 Tax=unclassified Bradyrhizobium TaxID=2631580 RepID=UPI001BAC85E2|nr:MULTISPECIES: MFS transporter [unclassified Bradyrhizobium]MBR1219999.1 MFS transporter [Bradyrhizobium sp. U87765 SZCCT0131]MBR1263545.1 MFS transporter [Bradyrhizobium sp. U87765 SZCCT0134]MBR1309114.1 MFS transporter [Bradyrhizobium sp. U87765 SZCCT0110]MBR1323877.1 MFS transporter [Bradyrhizobium sp. U87765 SZCCT0109]MBR1349429.1 MFS transporter [Bradyrhizobium sp. U87765 SZCCT0048]